MHNKRWVISSPLTPQAEEGLVRFPPILKQILFNRGLANYEEARAFMRAVVAGLADLEAGRESDLDSARERLGLPAR